MKKTNVYKVRNYVKFFKKNETKRLMLRAIFSDLRFHGALRLQSYLKLMKSDSGLTKITYSCIESSQTKGVVKFFNVYRMIFRENASFANYVGIKKSSW